MIVQHPVDLVSGFFREHYPSTVPGGWVEAIVSYVQTGRREWRVDPERLVHPAPAPQVDWIQPSAAPGGPLWVRGIDFTQENGQIILRHDLRPFVAHKIEETTGRVVIWYGTRVVPPPRVARPQPPSYASLVEACVRYTDSPAFRQTGVVTDIAPTGRGWVVATDHEVVSLPSSDEPGVAIGDPVQMGQPAGKAWRMIRVGPEPVQEPRIALPLSLLPPNISQPIVFRREPTDLVVDTKLPMTRVRFAVGAASIADASWFWWGADQAAEATGKSLAHALDRRTQPFGEPRASDLPQTVIPSDLVATLVVGGAGYFIQTDPSRFGPNANSRALDDYPAGPHAAVWAAPSVLDPPLFLAPFPVFAQMSVVVEGIVGSGTAEFTSPVSWGSAAVSVKISAAGSGIAVPPNFIGTGSLVVDSITASGTADSELP